MPSSSLVSPLGLLRAPSSSCLRDSEKEADWFWNPWKMKLLSIGGWQDGLARFQSWWTSDPAAAQGQRWAGYSVTLPLWRFRIKEPLLAQHKRYKMWWRLKSRSAFAEVHLQEQRLPLTQFHFLFVNETHLFQFLSPSNKLRKCNIKTIWLQTEPWLVCQAVF